MSRIQLEYGWNMDEISEEYDEMWAGYGWNICETWVEYRWNVDESG